MNKKITLGIILFIILAVGIWNPNLLEGVTSATDDEDPPPTPSEQVAALNIEFETAITTLKKYNSSVRGIQKLKQNLILVLEQVILSFLVPSEKSTSNSMFTAMLSEAVLKYITLYNGLRSMPYKQFGRN